MREEVFKVLIHDRRSGTALIMRIKADSVERAAMMVYVIREAIEEASRN